MVQISRYQVVLILIWTILGTGIVTMPGTIAQFTVQDAWAAGVGLCIGGFLCATIAAMHVRFFPDKSLIQVAMQAFGWIGGEMFAIWYVIYGVVTLATVGRELSAFVVISVLPNTPEFFISTVAFAVAAYLTYQGIEVVGRVNQFIVPLAAIVAPLLFSLSVRTFEWQPFHPMFSSGWLSIWQASVVPTFAYGLEFSVVLQWVPALRTPRTLPMDIGIASAISAAVLVILVTLTVGVLGEPVRYLTYPVLEVVRSIRQGKFVERLDTLYVMGVVVTQALKLSAFQLSTCEAIKDMCHSKDVKWTVIPCALLIWSVSNFMFHNLFDVTEFILRAVPAYFLFTVVICPAIIYMTAWWRTAREVYVFNVE
ncbi:GerAB/ArcD/ProY family transporter [Alicyclobacillus hesperidum]|uniref:GerAB/ArcD/ProY family transporter n=1 Tax=Alicyclobacillus hesperidum TaxID=89784 RepID=UPI0002E7F907|nr:endospore germination permease [Alicyclobacillus hesperidum]